MPPYLKVDPKISIVTPIKVTEIINTAIFFILNSFRFGMILNWAIRAQIIVRKRSNSLAETTFSKLPENVNQVSIVTPKSYAIQIPVMTSVISDDIPRVSNFRSKFKIILGSFFFFFLKPKAEKQY